MEQAAQSKPGVNFWLEKTPVHTLHLRQLLDYYPQARFIGIERSLEQVALSSLGRQAQARPDTPPSKLRLAQIVWHWRKYRAYLHHFAGRYPERFFLLQYESLKADPERHFKACLDYLGLEWEPQTLDERFTRNTSFTGRAAVQALDAASRRWIRLVDGLASLAPYPACALQERFARPASRRRIRYAGVSGSEHDSGDDSAAPSE
jgi:hypothetical protein